MQSVRKGPNVPQTVQSCAIDMLGALPALPFVACMSHAGATPDKDAQACAAKTGVDHDKLADCYGGVKVWPTKE